MTSYKILIVDDDPDDLDIMHEAFQMQGFTDYLMFSSAEDVFSYLQSVTSDDELPRLIITDLNMPGISGHELLQALKGMQRYKGIDVFVYSTSSNQSHIDLCLAMGAKEYISKPSALVEYQKIAERVYKEVKS